MKKNGSLEIQVLPGTVDGYCFWCPVLHTETKQAVAKMIVKVNTLPHPDWNWVGEELTYKKAIVLNVAETCFGFAKQMERIDGKILTIKIDSPIKQCGNHILYRLAGYGMPKPKTMGKAGDLLLHFEIQLPYDRCNSWTNEEKETVKKLFENAEETKKIYTEGIVIELVDCDAVSVKI